MDGCQPEWGARYGRTVCLATVGEGFRDEVCIEDHTAKTDIHADEPPSVARETSHFTPDVLEKMRAILTPPDHDILQHLLNGPDSTVGQSATTVHNGLDLGHYPTLQEFLDSSSQHHAVNEPATGITMAHLTNSLLPLDDLNVHHH